MIEARQIRKTFRLEHRTIEVLRGVDLTLKPGEFISIQGASGAGKSTLLQILGGLDRPDAGEVLMDGKSLAGLSVGSLAGVRNRRFGFIFQSYQLLPELDAVENVMLPAFIAGRDARARAASLLAEVGLGARLAHRPGELSGGEQQRVAIARALINEPDYLWADEPTGNLDKANGGQIFELLLTLAAARKTALVLVTHDGALAARASRHYVLKEGRLVDQ